MRCSEICEMLISNRLWRPDADCYFVSIPKISSILMASRSCPRPPIVTFKYRTYSRLFLLLLLGLWQFAVVVVAFNRSFRARNGHAKILRWIFPTSPISTITYNEIVRHSGRIWLSSTSTGRPHFHFWQRQTLKVQSFRARANQPSSAKVALKLVSCRSPAQERLWLAGHAPNVGLPSTTICSLEREKHVAMNG